MLKIANIELLISMAETLNTAVAITDAELDYPGPWIGYVNRAFTEMTGFERTEIIGRSPRMLQTRETSSSTLRDFGKSLRKAQRFQGVIKNRRGCGELYYCEVDVRPLLSDNGSLAGFIAFEREAVRRRGRPGNSLATRFKPRLPSTENEVPGLFQI